MSHKSITGELYFDNKVNFTGQHPDFLFGCVCQLGRKPTSRNSFIAHPRGTPQSHHSFRPILVWRPCVLVEKDEHDRSNMQHDSTVCSYVCDVLSCSVLSCHVFRYIVYICMYL